MYISFYENKIRRLKLMHFQWRENSTEELP